MNDEKKPTPEWVKLKQQIQKTPMEEVIFTNQMGVDGVADGRLPNGLPYEWKKRRP